MMAGCWVCMTQQHQQHQQVLLLVGEELEGVLELLQHTPMTTHGTTSIMHCCCLLLAE